MNNKEATVTETIDDLTINYTEDGVLTAKELDKVVLTRGAWVTILFRYQEWDRAKGEYGSDKYAIRRYQKRHGEYKLQSKFVISSADQARRIIESLQAWLGEG